MSKTLLIVLLFLLPAMLWAQKITVSGTVTDAASGDQLPGVSVVIKGTIVGTTTDFNGQYKLEASKGDVLVFAFMGMNSLEVKVAAESQIDVRMEYDTNILADVVVVGYGTEKRSVITGAISSIKSEDIQKSAPLRLEQALQGKTPGVQVISNNGQPGEGVSISIRGFGSNGSNTPLYVVDGIAVGGIDYLNPSDIASLEVLKDAASTAIYGARAANGVVLITTKGGKKQSISVNYDGYKGFQNAWRKMAVLNATEYAMVQNEAALSAGRAPVYPLDLAGLGEGTDWQNEIFTSNAPIENHYFSVEVGGEKSTLSASFGYFDQQGIVGAEKSEFKRYTFNLRSTHELTDYLSFGNSFGYTAINRKSLDGNSEWGSPLSNAINMDPITKVYADEADAATYNVNAVKNGSQVYGISKYVAQEIVNPLAKMAVANGDYNLNKIVGNVWGEVKLMEGLTLRSQFGLDLAYGVSDNYKPVYYLNAAQKNEITSVSKSIDRWYTWSVETYMTYKKQFGLHDLKATLGTSANKYQTYNMGGSKDNLVSTDPTMWYLDAATNEESQKSYGGADHSSLLSYFGRVNYNYAEKYLFSATVRMDGSSKFGSNNRFGTFPSVSAGWAVHNEEFMKGISAINSLKLRASWGQNGNENIGTGNYVGTISTGAGYTIGNVWTGGATPTRIPNPDLKWETSEQTDFGVDAELFHNSLVVNLDYYIKTTKDWLVTAPILGHVGNNAPLVNGGDIQNKGIELAVTYRGKVGKVDYSTTLNAAYNMNEVTRIDNAEGVLSGSGFATYGTVTRGEVGQPIGFFYGYKTDGLFQNTSEVDAYTGTTGGKIQPDAKPGDIRFVDINGDGVISDKDRTNIGNPIPAWNLGWSATLSYANFDLDIFVQSALGQDIFNGTRRHDLTQANMPASFLDRWTGEGTSNSIPRITLDDKNGNYKNISDFYIEDGSYMRVKNIQLSYNFSKSLLANVGLKKARVYVAMKNALTLTKYQGFDPEVGGSGSLGMGIDRCIYPQARTVMFGLNLGF